MDSGALTEPAVALARLAERCPGLLQAIGKCCTRTVCVSERDVLRAASGQWERADVLAALSSLARSGALTVTRARGYTTTSYAATTSIEQTIRDASAVAALLPTLRRQFDEEHHAKLVVSWPTALGELRLRQWRNSRITLVEMVDDAQRSVVLVFPFVDPAGVQEIAPAIERSFVRGIDVVLLTRYLGNTDSPNARLASRLARAAAGISHFEAINISSEKDPRRELLHAKVLVVDGGLRGYVGSANLTGSAFGESIEIGVAVDGAAAQSVAELVNELLLLGRVQ